MDKTVVIEFEHKGELHELCYEEIVYMSKVPARFSKSGEDEWFEEPETATELTVRKKEKSNG